MNELGEVMDDIKLDVGHLSHLMNTILEIVIQMPVAPDGRSVVDVNRVAALTSIATDLSHRIYSAVAAPSS